MNARRQLMWDNLRPGARNKSSQILYGIGDIRDCDVAIIVSFQSDFHRRLKNNNYAKPKFLLSQFIETADVSVLTAYHMNQEKMADRFYPPLFQSPLNII